MKFQNKIALILLSSILICYTFFMTRNSISLNDQFMQYGDFAAYDQVIHNLTQYFSFESSVCSSVMNYWNTVSAESIDKVPPVNPAYSVLGIHFIPMTFFFNTIPNFFWNTPNTTFFVHTLAFSTTAFILFLIFTHLKLNPILSFALSSSFLIHPANIGANLNAFHPVIMAVPLLSLMYYFLLKGNKWGFWILFFLTGLVQENLAISLGGISLWFLFNKQYKNFLFGLMGSLFFLIFTTKFMIPHFNPQNTCPYCSIYGSPLGGSMGEIIKNAILQPKLLWNQLSRPEVIDWFIQLNAQTLFLIILSPLNFLIALSGVVPNLLSNNKSMVIMWGQYSALAMPFIFIGTGTALSKFKLTHKVSLGASLLLVILSFYFSSTFALYEHTKPKNIFTFNQTIYQSNEVLESYQNALALIPQDSSVSSTETILNKIHRRKEAYIFPVGHLHSEYLVIQKSNLTIDFKIMNARIDEVIQSKLYDPIYDDKYIIVYKKRI